MNGIHLRPTEVAQRVGRIARLACGLLLVVTCSASCAIRFGQQPQTVEALRISEVVGEGDPARRASNRFVLKGLDADARGDPARALGLYEEALRVDATNPYAYLAIARYHASGDDPGWALSFIDKSDSLFRAEGGPSPRVRPHLVGLRGQALYASGEVDAGLPLLEEAWTTAPGVWTDGQLDAAELR